MTGCPCSSNTARIGWQCRQLGGVSTRLCHFRWGVESQDIRGSIQLKEGESMSWFARLAIALSVGVLLLTAGVPALADPAVSIAPADGSQTDTYQVAGTDLTPGLALDINFISPSGTVFSTAGLNQVVVVGGDGAFSFSFVPITEFTGESLGSWVAQVCTSGTDDCVQTNFSIGS
jgi:hypothetical protein